MWLVSVETFLEATHLPLLLPPEYSVILIGIHFHEFHCVHGGLL